MLAHEHRWIHDARRVLQQSRVDFFRASPARYWFDFLLSVTLAYGTATIYLMAPLGSWPQLIAFPIAVFWLYRLGSLVHEVAHLPQHELRAFKVTWNLVVGVMTLAPSPFFTRHHRDHHSQRMYGTKEDPEYIVNVFQPGSWLSIAVYAVYVLAFPLIVFLRFFLTPLGYVHPRVRDFVLRRASSLTMNWRYERRLTAHDRWAITVVEWLCWLRAVAIPLAALLGTTPWTRLPLLYSLAIGVLTLNQMRLLADHHFESEGGNMDLPDHIRDSCNYTSNDLLTRLFFPFSIRYHALHHLFPTLPYHNLAAAHAYLSENLAADSPYHSLDQPGWWPVAKKTLVGQVKPAKAALRRAA
jgi:fatty acid desaturase